jgi:ribosomal-protein-alanine N-acetyltransferase
VTRSPRRRATALEVRGEFVFLREPTRADERELLALRSASRAFLEPWEAEIPGVDFAGAAWFARYLRQGPRFGRRRLLVCALADRRILGSTTLSEAKDDAHVAVLGYWIGAEYARRGYMCEALQLALTLAFQSLRFERIEAYVLPENTPSKRLLAKLGFRHAGVAPAFQVIRGEARNHERWSLSSAR